MKIIPIPQKLEIKEGFLEKRKIILNNVPDDERIKNALRSFSTGEEGVFLQINMGSSTSEAYTIEIETEKVSISSDGCAGVFYAIQTLKQIFEQNEIPCCYIEDKPDFKYRGFYHDVTRGKVPTVATLKSS